MPSNLDRYKGDLDSLVAKGEELYLAMLMEGQSAEDRLKLQVKGKVKYDLNNLPSNINRGTPKPRY